MSAIPTNTFGRTDLVVSRIGFGAWAIGGPAMAGDIAIGWGDIDDAVSVRAIETALDRGIDFLDTADFYGLGHSEELIGQTIGNRAGVTIATKVGHRLNSDGSISLDYSKKHILAACDKSLRRLRRDHIDLYQLHSARVAHLKQGECIEAMEQLVAEGKIRYWGLSLSTYDPEPEGAFLMERGLGHSFQLVLSVINQRAVDLMRRAAAAGYGIIARMPLQFGLLAGRFNSDSRFGPNDHRSFRLTPRVLEQATLDLEPFFELARVRAVSPASIALAFVLSQPEVSTVIPGMRSPEQAAQNAEGPFGLTESEKATLGQLYDDRLKDLLGLMERQEKG
ncbi:MAG: aldo/keto reductase [Rhodothermales bacterium]|nr:aldo/keto reductase [Rhodothermales bacterium]